MFNFNLVYTDLFLIDETPTYCQIEMKGGICRWRCEGSAGHVKNYGHRKCKGRICCTDTYTGNKTIILNTIIFNIIIVIIFV